MLDSIYCFVGNHRGPESLSLAALAYVKGDPASLRVVSVEHKLDKCAYRLILNRVHKLFGGRHIDITIYADGQSVEALHTAVGDIDLNCKVSLNTVNAGSSRVLYNNIEHCCNIARECMFFDAIGSKPD